MATTPKLVGPTDPALNKSFETQTPSVARTSPPTISKNGTATSTGGTISRGIAPKVTGDTTTYNQATQASSGTELFIVSSNNNDSSDVVTVYNTEKQISVSALNQTFNNYRVTNTNSYGNSNVADFLTTYDGNLSAGSLNVLGATNLGDVSNVHIQGGTNGQVLSTNGSGALVWSNVSSGPSLGNITINGDNVSSTNDIVNIVGDNYAQLQSSNTYMWVEDGEADIEVNGNRWIFNDSGYMEIPNEGSFGALNSSILAFSSQNNKPIFIEVVDTGNSAAQQWIFDNEGNLTLPGNTFSVNYANGTQVPISGGGANTGNVTFNNINIIGTGNLHLQPDSASAASYLDIFLTSGPDLHLVASNGANLILGKDEQSNVMTSWDGNVYIQSWDNNTNTQGGVWTFDGDGNLTLPNDANIAIYGNTTQFNTCANGFLGLNSYDAGGNNIARVSISSSDGLVAISATNPITEVDYNWVFANGGVTLFPILSTQRGDNPSGTITGYTLNIGDGQQEAIITTPDGVTGSEYAQRLVINPGAGSNYGEGGDIYLWAGRGGDGSGSGGDIKIRGGQGGANTSGGNGGDGGYIRMEAGDAQVNGVAGYIDITGGQGGAGQGGGYVHITGGYGDTLGGEAKIYGGYGQATGGNVDIWGGASGNGQINEGRVNIQTGGKTWTYDASGNLTLPSNTFAVNYANGNQVQLGSSGNISQISNGNSNVSIPTSNDNVYITTNSGSSKQWIFDTAGNLRTPGNVDIYGAINFPQQVSSLNWSTYNIELSQYGRINTNVDFFANANVIGAQYLKGDGSNVANVSVTKIANGTSNVNIPTSNGNVVITANGSANWTFDTTGNLQTAGDIVGPASANLTIYANAGVHEFIFADDGTFYAPDNVVLGGNSIYIGPGANTLAGIEHEVLLASSNNFAYVQGVINNVSDNGSAEWVALGAKGDDSGGWGEVGFTSSGFGDANYTITGAGDGYVFAQAYAPGSLAPAVGGGNLVLATGNQGTTKDIIFGTGGFLTGNIFGRISNANNSFELSRANATITFPDGSIQSTAYTGGNANTGNVTFDDINIIGTGNLHLQPDPANASSYLDIYLTGGPDIHIAGNGETVILGTDDFANVAVNVDGNVSIQTGNVSGTKTWTFDTSGNLTLPLGSIVYETNIPDQSLSGSAIALKPAGGTTANQQLLIYPTANDGDHVHMTSGNLYATELFLGSDNFYVKLANTGNIVINSNDGNSSNAMWTFSNDGTTTFPTGNITSNTSLQFTTTFANVKTVEYQTAGVWDLYVEDSITGSNTASSRLNVSFKDNLIDKPQVYIENTKESDGIALRWTFDENGNLTLPSNLVIAGNTSVFGTNAALIAPDNNLPLLSVSSGSNGGVSSLWVEDIGNVGTSNIAAVYTNPTPGSGIVRIAVGQNGGAGGPNLWDFNANGTTTIPGGLIGSGASPAPYISGFDSISSITLSASGNITGGNIIGNGNTLSNVATKTTGNWTLAPGVNTVSVNVPINGTYSIWVNGNIPNGIITYTATAVVTNTNVPVLGEQYGWFYEAGNALVLTSIPNQFVGTQGAISNASPYSGNTANVFTFGITNNSGSNAVVNYGYTKL